MTQHKHLNIDPNLWLDDATATRFARRMLTELYGIEKHVQSRMQAFLTAQGKRFILGNPISQKREFARVQKIFAPSLLHSWLIAPGKRAFEMHFMAFVGFPEIDMLLLREIVYSREQKGKFQHKVTEHIAISTHALARMIQRAGILQTDDCQHLIGEIWPRLVLIGDTFSVLHHQGHDIGRMTLPLPIVIKGQRMLLICTVPEIPKAPIAVTVYPTDWKATPELAALEAVIDSEKWNATELMPLFLAVAPHFSRSK